MEMVVDEVKMSISKMRQKRNKMDENIEENILTEKLEKCNEKKSNTLFEEVYSKISDDLKKSGKKKVWGHLFKEVIQTGKCIHCGACYSSCEVLGWDEEKEQPKLIGKCNGCGVCYYQCYVTKMGHIRNLGHYLEIYEGQNNHPKLVGERIQNGGVVSIILYYLLKEEGYDGVIAVQNDSNNPWHPKAKFIKNLEDIKKCGGTIYSHAQVIPPLFEEIFNNGHKLKKIAFVGTPCNIDAIVNIMESENGFFSKLNKLGNQNLEIFRIGLFCMEAFNADNLIEFLKSYGINPEQISKMEVSGNKLHIFLMDRNYKNLINNIEQQNAQDLRNVFSIPIKELERFRETSCNFCTDFSAENADISVGNVGTPDDRNTIIIRNEKSKAIIDNIIKKGYLKVKKLDFDNIKKVINLSNIKKSKEIPEFILKQKFQSDKFILHEPNEWANINYGFKPVISMDKYIKKEFKEYVINKIDKEK